MTISACSCQTSHGEAHLSPSESYEHCCGGCLATKPRPFLPDPVGCSPPGSSVHGILQATTLEWAATSFSRGSSWPRDQTHVSCIGRQILCHWATREVHSVRKQMFLCILNVFLLSVTGYSLGLRNRNMVTIHMYTVSCLLYILSLSLRFLSIFFFSKRFLILFGPNIMDLLGTYIFLQSCSCN